jgi:hypothetical protein
MKQTFKNSKIQSAISLSGLLLLFFFTSLILSGLVYYADMDTLLPVLFISLGLFALFFLALLITWLSGLIQAQRIRKFLAGERPVIRWEYTPQEWYEIKEEAWQDEKGDWRIQWGCLTFLFGLIGLMVGVLIGAEEGMLEAVSGGLVGVVLGSLIGGMIGAAVGAGNILAAKYAYKRTRPWEVALAPGEFYTNDSYIRFDPQRTDHKLELQTESKSTLHFEVRIYKPFLFREWDMEWSILVPDRMVEMVRNKLSLLN